MYPLRPLREQRNIVKYLKICIVNGLGSVLWWPIQGTKPGNLWSWQFKTLLDWTAQLVLNDDSALQGSMTNLFLVTMPTHPDSWTKCTLLFA